MENFMLFIFLHNKKKLSKLNKKEEEKRNECHIHAASQRQTLAMPWKQGREDTLGS